MQEPAKDGIFTGTLPQGSSTDYYAVFNNSTQDTDEVEFNSSTKCLELTIRNDKPAWANNVFNEGIPLVAKVSEGTVNFKHIFGLLKVTLSATETFSLKRIAVHDLAGNMLWGKCSVPINENGELDCESITMTGGDNTITMTLNTAKKIGTGEGAVSSVSYYVPVPQGTLEGGFSVVLYEYDATKTEDKQVGRAYTFMQKITGTMAMPRGGILGVNAPVTAKPEAYDAKERGYYKSLFVNAGYGLDGFTGTEAIPAIEYMHLDKDCEYYSCNKNDAGLSMQTSVIIGNDEDVNGVLLYPDGSPRFRLIFNRGGSSTAHGPSLGTEGRSRFKNFFDNGGSYSGVCAGAFLAAKTVSDAEIKTEFTYGLVDINLKHTSLPISMSTYSGIYTNMEILPKAKTAIEGVNGDGKFNLLLDEKGENMTTYSSNVAIKDVMHHGGGYLPTAGQTLPEEMEQLMKYRFSNTSIENPTFLTDGQADDAHYYRENNWSSVVMYPHSSNRDGWVSTWAYKAKDGKTGRAVCTGSHPEGKDREGRDCDVQFTGFMFRYAMEGNGDTRVKNNELTLGKTRYMNTSPSSYNDPASSDAGIGDGQYHHFKFTVPPGGYDNFVLRLDSDCDSNSGIDLYLGLRRQVSTDGTVDLAWLSEADYTLCNKGGQKEFHINHLPAGDWYVSVFCATKVTAEETAEDVYPRYFRYTDKTKVLNGIPYSITITTEDRGVAKDFFPSAFGETGDDFSKMDD